MKNKFLGNGEPITHNQYNKTQRLNNSWRTYAIKIMQENKVMQEKKGTK